MSKKQEKKDIYTKNIEALLKVNPKLAVNIFKIKTNEKFEVFAGSDPININIVEKSGEGFLYIHPVDDVEAKLNDIENAYSRYPSLFFYGIGNGVLYKALLANVAHKVIVIFEPQIELLYIALSLIDFSKDIKEKRLRLFNAMDVSYYELYELAKDENINPYVKLYNIDIHSKYYDKFKDNIVSLNQNMSNAIKQMVLSHGNDTRDALVGIAHHIQNTPDMLKSIPFKSIIKKRSKKRKTAVIVSTGPSLTKQLDLLKEYAPYVTIISIDASLPILQKHGIKPDYVASIERVEYTSRFFLNLDKELLKDTIFMLPSLTHKQSIVNLKDFQKSIIMRPFNFTRAFEMDDFGYVGIGMSAANSAYEIAAFLKHENILLIGQDLAFSDDGKSHAANHIYGENEKKVDNNSIMTLRYGGVGLIATTWIWNLFRGAFEVAIEEAKHLKINTYNCTQGGSRINGSIEMPFKEALEKFADKNPKHLEKVEPFDDETIKLNAKKIEKTYKELKKYILDLIAKIEKLFLEIAPKIDNFELLYLEEKKNEIDYDEIANMIKEIDIIKDEIESKKFTKYCVDATQAYIYTQELNLAKLAVAIATTDDEKRDKMLKWVIAHKYWLFTLAGGLQSQINAMETTEEIMLDFFKSLNK